MPQSAAETGNVTGSALGGETLHAPLGHSSVSGAGGGDHLAGTTGDNRFWISDSKDRITDPGGVDTAIGWMSLTLQPGIENLEVHGDFNYAVGNGLDNLIIVDGSQWVDGGLGDDVLVGSKDQRTTFIARAGGGNDVIYSWNDNSQIHFVDYGFKSAADVRAAMAQQGSDVVIRLSTTETLTVRDTTMASYVDRQFLLPVDTSKLGALTFHDEFDSLRTFDPNTGNGQWQTSYGGNLKDVWAYTLPSNGELQAYVQPGFYGQGTRDLGVNPFSVADGVLTITAASPDPYATYFRPYTSGMLNTLGTFSQQYGYFEARVATPNVAGTWPAFWMVPSPYVPNVEADIFEALGITPHVDYRRAWGGDGVNGTQYDNAYKPDPEGFHTYGMLWTQSNVTFYLDGVAVMTGPTPTTWTHPMSLIVNLAVGGWGGQPDQALYPAELKVDYVRAYGLADGSSQVVSAPPASPIATLKADGPASGEIPTPPVFAENGQPVTTGRIVVAPSPPTTPPPPHTFVIWEEAGAVFGVVSAAGGLSKPTTLLAGTASQFDGEGTWLTTGKVVTSYLAPGASGGQDLWCMVFDPSDGGWTRQNLGPAAATGDVSFVATAAGGFAVSWRAPDGGVVARGYDEYAYGGDVPGWYGPVRAIGGDLIGVNAKGQLIAATPSGQELYHLHAASMPPALTAATVSPADTAPAVEPQAPTVDSVPVSEPTQPAGSSLAAPPGDPGGSTIAATDPGQISDQIDFSAMPAPPAPAAHAWDDLDLLLGSDPIDWGLVTVDDHWASHDWASLGPEFDQLAASRHATSDFLY